MDGTAQIGVEVKENKEIDQRKALAEVMIKTVSAQQFCDTIDKFTLPVRGMRKVH